MNPFLDEMTKVASEASDDANTYKWTNRLGAVGGIIGAVSGPYNYARALEMTGSAAAHLPPAAAIGSITSAALVGGLAGVATGAGSGAVIDSIRHAASGRYARDQAEGKDPFKWTRRAAVVGAAVGGLAGLPHPSLVVEKAIGGAGALASLGGIADWARS